MLENVRLALNNPNTLYREEINWVTIPLPLLPGQTDHAETSLPRQAFIKAEEFTKKHQARDKMPSDAIRHQDCSGNCVIFIVSILYCFSRPGARVCKLQHQGWLFSHSLHTVRLLKLHQRGHSSGRLDESLINHLTTELQTHFGGKQIMHAEKVAKGPQIMSVNHHDLHIHRIIMIICICRKILPRRIEQNSFI